MVDIPFSYYLCYSESNGYYINLSLYEVANTLKGPVISKSYLTDIDTELLLADNYKQLNQYEDSEKCLKKASYMIPNRFIPLYNLLLLYEIKKDSINAKKVANEILNKQIKVDSYKVRQMKKRVRHDYPDL